MNARKRVLTKVDTIKAASRLFALITLVLSLFIMPRTSRGYDTWYVDVQPTHWAYKYIRTLWEEEVTNGWPEVVPVWNGSSWNYLVQTFYYPNLTINRAQYAIMLAKAFQLEPVANPKHPFSDVSPDYLEYGMPASRYIEAAHEAGLIGNGLRFYPSLVLQRQVAISMLVLALNLGDYASSLSNSEVDIILARYSDRNDIASDYKRTLAAATKLKMVEGYPDGTLRPTASLTRAEAATLVYRACMFSLEASPNPFSPDGDGIEDYSLISPKVLRNRNVSNWIIELTRYNGDVVRTFRPQSVDAPPTEYPPVIAWDGTSDTGLKLLPGVYYYKGSLWDRNGQVYNAIMKPLTLEHNTVLAFLNPNVTVPGGQVSLIAHTTGRALRVTAVAASNVVSGTSYPLALYKTGSGDESNNDWETWFTVSQDAPEGTHEIRVTAEYYSGSVRRTTALLQVVDPIIVTGSAAPNPARPGQKVTVRADTSPNVVSVDFEFLDQSNRMRLVNADEFSKAWIMTFALPIDIEPGTYYITLDAYAKNKHRSVSIELRVLDNPLKDVMLILTE